MAQAVSVTTELHGTWRSPDGECTVSISRPVFEDMLRLARERSPMETGTALMGSYSDDGHDAVVTELAPLSADSRGERFTFHRGVAGLRRFLGRVFRKSGGRTHYVGEWHSHPGGSPVPSGTDEANTFEIANDPKAMCGECILVILALHDDGPDVGVFVFSRVRGRIDLVPSAPEQATPLPTGCPR